MRVLMLVPGYGRFGGVARSAERIVKGLGALGHQVMVSSHDPDLFPGQLEGRGTRVERFGAFQRAGGLAAWVVRKGADADDHQARLIDQIGGGGDALLSHQHSLVFGGIGEDRRGHQIGFRAGFARQAVDHVIGVRRI